MPIPALFTTPRAAITAVFAAFGAAVGSIAGSMPTITKASGIDSLTLGLGITVSTLGTILMMACGGVIARHVSNRAILLASIPGFGVLLMALLTAASPSWFFLAYFLLGLNIGLTDIFMNAEGAAIEHDGDRPIFTAFHGSVSVGMPVFAILSSFLSVRIGPWATGLCAGAALGISWVMVYHCIPARPVASGQGSRISALRHKAPLIVLGLATGLFISGELAAILWSAKLLEEQAPGLAAVAGLGAAFYGICNAGLRLPGDRLRARFGDLPLMMGSLIVAMTGFAALGLSPNFTFSVAAFAVAGLGTAVLTPCAFALAARLVPDNRAAGISFVSAIAGVPRILGPWLFGWMAAATGISAAFGFYAGIMAMALGLIMVLRRMKQLDI